MSLDWSIERVQDFESRCWRPSPMAEDKSKNRVVLEVDTEALVWAAMMIDVGSIRRTNIDEWHFRIEYLKRLEIEWHSIWDGKKSIPTYPTYDQIADHIGLSTNVSTVARQKWIKRIARGLEREVERSIKREIQERETDE